MNGVVESYREYIEREFGEAVGNVQRGLADGDVKEFWR